MESLVFLLMFAAIAAVIGLVMAAGMMVILSLAPQKRFRAIPLFVMFVLVELDWLSLWFISLFFIGHGMNSNREVYSLFGILLFGLGLPVLWVTYARIGIARQKISPVLLSLQKLE